MSEPTYTTSQIFKHMTPGTLCAWVSDFDENPEHLEETDLALMSAAIMELFDLVGMEAIDMLGNYGIDADHPMVMAAVEAYNEGAVSGRRAVWGCNRVAEAYNEDGE